MPKSRLVSFIVPIFLFSIIWSAEEFFISARYSEANISIEVMGMLFAFSSIISLLLDIPAGKLSDKIGRQKLIAYSMLLVAVAMFLLYASSTLIAFIASTGLIGVAYGLNWSPLLAYVGDSAKKYKQGSNFAGFFTLTAIGEAVAPLLTVAMVSYSNNRFPFLVFSVVALACAFMFARLKPEHVPVLKKTKKPMSFSYASSVAIIHKIGPRSLFLLFMGFFVAFFWESVWFSQPLVGVFEDSLINAALIVAAFSIPTIIFSKPLGWLIDKIGEKKVFFYSITLVVISFLSFYLSQALIAKVAFIFLAAVGVLGVWLVLDVLSVKINEAGQRGEFFGILETVRDASYAIAPLFIGFSYKAIGLNGVFLVNSIIACFLLFFGVLIFRGKTVY